MRCAHECGRVPAMKTMTHMLFLAVTAGLAFAGCASETEIQSSSAGAASTVICTPFQETCDWGCYYQHGPSTDDCIIKCNAQGTAWNTITDCGWAQNFPYSSSCLDSQPHPICKNN